MPENHILKEKKEHIFYITLNREKKRNALTFEMLQEICEIIEGLINDPEIRVVIIRGKGTVFSSGVDFNSLGSLVGRFRADTAAGGAPIRSDINKLQHYLNRLETIEIPIICAIHGAVFGMAVELALACDFRLMSTDCIWGLPEAKFGLIADLGGTARLSRMLGPSRAMEILMTARRYTAAQALDWGLAAYLYPTREKLYKEADNLAMDIIKMAPLAVGAVKKVVNKGDGVDLMTHLDMEGDMQSILMRTADFQEGITALMEKRDPIWQKK
ncbi:MAG: enoyl-CoA hydratase/isomerase family protein [Deltaproteobacteria bacterium]|nr:enoyl-CoA hydratase/isomerase family protein [Deltaproteobacteria bacterium]